MDLAEITDKKFLAKGKRGEVYIGYLKEKKVAIKIKRKDSTAIARMEIEAKFLQILNKHNIGPKFVASGKDYLVYEFVEGVFIEDYIKNNKREKILKTLKDIFGQLYLMDRLGINKEEMNHPVKHIIIEEKPVMIDFERCRFTQKPHNTTQFCQFISSQNLKPLLEEKNIWIDSQKLRVLAGIYKEDVSEKNFKPIITLLLESGA